MGRSSSSVMMRCLAMVVCRTLDVTAKQSQNDSRRSRSCCCCDTGRSGFTSTLATFSDSFCVAKTHRTILRSSSLTASRYATAVPCDKCWCSGLKFVSSISVRRLLMSTRPRAAQTCRSSSREMFCSAIPLLTGDCSHSTVEHTASGR